MELLKESICASTNRDVASIDKIFPSYSVALNMLQGEVSDDELNQSKYVFNQLLSSEPSAKEIYQDMSSTKDYLLPRIYIGDINSDGYPDILVTIKYNNGSSIPQVLLNK